MILNLARSVRDKVVPLILGVEDKYSSFVTSLFSQFIIQPLYNITIVQYIQNSTQLVI